MVAPVTTPKGSLVPVPTENFDASSSSFESCNRPASSAWRPLKSCPTSIEKGTNARAFSVETVGCASVGLASVAAVASAAYAAVIPEDATPRHSSPVIDSTREIARKGLIARFEVGMIVGSSSELEAARGPRQGHRTGKAHRVGLLGGHHVAGECLPERLLVDRRSGDEHVPGEPPPWSRLRIR